MSKNYEKLISLLKQMFQLNQADLDFGIYRIMNFRRKEIENFLSEELLPQVRSQLERYISSKQKSLKKELDDLKKTLDDTGVVYESSAKYVALKNQLDMGMDIEKAEEEIYSHLTDFFSRYYSNGDFISQRRYKQGVYAIPYEGEEVKLYWANADQYYIKTTEYFRDYTFTLPEGKKVHFKLVEASTEKDNNKSDKDKERKFVLYEEEPLKIENNELYIQFEYKVHESKQKDLIDNAVKKINEIFTSEGVKYRNFIEIFKLKPTESNPKRTVLEKHLTDYTARNTFDYFIHKDLGGFLRRELDFYLKNEVMFLDDLDTEHEVRIEQYITKIKVIKNIGYKIISFLEQIENFQKKLWLKKKFVVEANYCITLDRIDENFYTEIVENKKQVEEWKKLFAIDEIDGYSEPLTLEFLKANPYLVLDTAFFSEEFKERLIESIKDIDDKTDGLLIKSENFQALNLLMERYKEQVKCVYIDPPYNTGNDGFIYKDKYKHSSWLSMMFDRILICKIFTNQDSRLFVSIDDNENSNLLNLEKQIFGEQNFVGNITWEKRTKAQNTETAKYMLQSKVEYIHVFRMGEKKQEFNLEKKGEKEYPLSDELGVYRLQEIGQMSSNGMRGRKTMIFPIKGIMPNENMQWKIGIDEINKLEKEQRIIIKEGKPYIIYRPEHEEGIIYTPFWSHFFEKDIYGTAENGLNEVGKQLGFGSIIETVKPISLIKKIIFHANNNFGYVLDFFAGSGTTANAIIELNREDGGSRKYILVEMGEYFDTVTKPRVQKVIYSKDWKDGKPVSREGISHIFKYIKLESYEDTLNNIEIKRTQEQQIALDEYKDIREQYILSYMLDKEAESSVSLLNIDKFANPFDYKMKIADGLETKEINVDLVETFNYLLGLVVTNICVKESFDTEADLDSEILGAVKLKSSDFGKGEYTFKAVEGNTLSGDKVLIIWRTLTGDIAKDNAALDAYFKIKGYSTQKNKYNRIYVNGDNNLMNIKQNDETWKVVLIEEEFKRLMFDVQDI
ncbi:adenine-specific DNA-methyltransferase [Alkalithermobacter thermoalcaliphilus JW-YL-7 = DSM 7308]|uniref:Adenine-specific DNA-methyltransferase n=1 Tax=Alkalithermobacter thermoalcaliphilus JW-YL-7 = DSM 7308 TaxID=1121328 RepID=A0A150FUJ9_CLOPD|nr:DNA methylase N-4/N-6 domain protein [[Clostridium] paradoxum JW-YL-7 = DSM 7308]SHL10150.1 adenine-specific DNA-methyltransferase [[Clostridium] paradoxum JW-YL-7 = DSM 7308]